MYTLGIDTSFLFLLITLMDDDKVIDSIKMDCLKKQSEFIIVKIDELLQRNSLSLKDVDKLVVTVGPGSYTGVRIGMTLAKVLGSIVGKQIYTLSTLQLYAGKKDCLVIMDAKAKRCYVGDYVNGKAVKEDCVMFNEDIAQLIQNNKRQLVGDLHLFNLEDNYQDIAENFMALKEQWQLVENVDILNPTYLKSKEEYLKV